MSLMADVDVEKAIAKGHLEIEPFNPKQLGPASYDVTLDHRYRRPTEGVSAIDVRNVPAGHTRLVQTGPIVLRQHDFILASTVEKIRVGEGFAVRVEGRSSLGRLGLLVHVTAGFIDPGFEGNVTLEIVNLAPWSIELVPGMRIAQLGFYNMTRRSRQTYGAKGHYQDQEGPTESRLQVQV
jgi:dCTP deaminase